MRKTITAGVLRKRGLPISIKLPLESGSFHIHKLTINERGATASGEWDQYGLRSTPATLRITAVQTPDGVRPPRDAAEALTSPWDGWAVKPESGVTSWKTFLNVADRVGDNPNEAHALEIGVRELGSPNYRPKTIRGLKAIQAKLGFMAHGGHGVPSVPPMRLYTRRYVYVTAIYDGATWWEPVPLEPGSGQPARYIGGE